MSLKQSVQIGRVRFTSRPILGIPKEPLNQAVGELSKIFSLVEIRPPQSIVLDEIIKKFRNSIDLDSGWDSITAHEWSLVPYAFFVEPYIVDQFIFRTQFEIFYSKNQRTRLFRILIHIYLREYCSDRTCFNWLSRLIQTPVKEFSISSLSGWKALHERFMLFEPGRGENNVALEFLKSKNPPDLFFESIGMTGELAVGGFVKATYLAALHHISLREPNSNDFGNTLNRVLEWSSTGKKSTSNSNLKTLKFQDYRLELIHSILAPWKTGQTPSKDQKKQILEFFTTHYGDPRINPALWTGASAWALTIIRRWLAEGTLEQFFQILDHHALDVHWIWRRRFWMSYYKRQVLEEAWLALGPVPYNHAKEVFSSGVSAGKLEGITDKCHSVLVMKISGLTIAEWSHSGKCRIWITEKGAPKLYRRLYKREELLRGDSEFIHHGSPNGTWQREIARFIKNQTGIEIRSHDYMN